MDPVRDLLRELKSNPSKFERDGGFERLLELMRDGCSPVAAKELLRGTGEFIGDILWVVRELHDVTPFVAEAERHINDADRETAAYAVEIVLRGAQDARTLREVLRSVRSAPLAVREHAVLVLAAQGLRRARDVLQLGQCSWAAELVDDLVRESRITEEALTALAGDSREDRLLLGLLIATIASERDERAVGVLEQSDVEWVRDFAGRLRRMFAHRWRA